MEYAGAHTYHASPLVEPAASLDRIWSAAESSVRSIFEAVTLADILRDALSDRLLGPAQLART